jgi:hypothetical protein
MRLRGGEGTTRNINDRSAQEDTDEDITPTRRKGKVTMDNLPFGHVCDDIAVDNDTPYKQLYCQNVCGIYDREGIGLDSVFKGKNRYIHIQRNTWRRIEYNSTKSTKTIETKNVER